MILLLSWCAIGFLIAKLASQYSASVLEQSFSFAVALHIYTVAACFLGSLSLSILFGLPIGFALSVLLHP